MQAVVMAGGAGTRLRPLTTAAPKALLPIVGQPMLTWVIRLLESHGFDRIVVTLQHQASVVLKYFGSDVAEHVNLRFLTEPKPLGTAGSVRYCLPWLDESEDVLVIAGDCLTDLDLGELMRRHRDLDADLTIALARRADPRNFGVVTTDPTGRVVDIVEKPSWGEVSNDAVSTGIYIVDPSALHRVPADEHADWAQDILPEMLTHGDRVYGVEIPGYWEDVGSFPSYMGAQRDVLDGKVRGALEAFEVSPGILVATGAEVSPEAHVRAPAFIGPYAKVEPDAVIGPYSVVGTNALIRRRAVVDHCVLHANVFVGEDAELRGAIVGRAAEIRRSARLLTGSVVADGCTIMDGAVIGTEVMVYPGKTIDEGSVVDESVVWESASQRQIFSDGRVRGIVNVDMTPERIVRLAAAFATTLPKGASVTVGRDHSRSARALNRALAGALTAAGVTVRDLRAVPTALVRNDTDRYSDGGVILRTTPGRADSMDVQFLTARGAEIGAAQRDALERIFTRKEFRRPLSSDIGDIRTPHRVVDDYVNDVEAFVDMESIRRSRPRMVLDAGGGPAVNVLSMLMGRPGIDALTVGTAIAEDSAADPPVQREAALQRLSSLVVSSGSHIGARIGPVGERLSVVDELGRVIEDGRMLLVMLDLVAAHRREGVIAVPVSASRLAEQVAAYHGVGVLRIGVGATALAAAAADPTVVLAGDGNGRFVLPQVGPGPDGVCALMMLLSLMGQTQMSLSELDARIPATAVESSVVAVPWHRRASALRAVHDTVGSRRVDMTDGVRIVEEDGSWCLVLPNDDGAAMTLYAEAADRASAHRLLHHWTDILEGA